MTLETTAFWSGHANSSAMVARMFEIGDGPDRVVHACTGLEFDEVYEYMEKFEKFLGIDIIYEDVTKEKPQYEFWNFFNKPWMVGCHNEGEIHGAPMMKNPCWHNRNVKQPVFNKYEKISSEVFGGFTVNERHRTIGVNKTCIHKYPLIEWQWTAEDSISYLRRKGIPHKMYDVYGFKRLGCCICPKQNDNALYIIYKNFPEIWDVILDMEDKSPKGFRSPNHLTPYELMDLWDKERPEIKLSEFNCGKP